MSFDIRTCAYFNSTKAKFFSNVEKTKTCWFWKAGKSHGYGSIQIATKIYQAHRLSYMLFNGPIPHDKIVRHTCDIKHCVNPKHLILGTQADNAEDRIKRDPTKRQKLNPEAVKVIKWMLKYRPSYGLASKLARLYKVHPNTIAGIKKNKYWYWVKLEKIHE
jgi:hypothetical protein